MGQEAVCVRPVFLAEPPLAEKPCPAPGLDDTCQLRRDNRGPGIAQCTRTAGEMLQFPCSPLARRGGGRLRCAGFVMFEQMRHRSCDLVRRRHAGLLGAQPRPHRATRGSKGCVGPCDCLRDLVQRLGRAVDDFEGPRAPPAAPGDVVVRGEPQPRAHVLPRRALPHIRANLGEAQSSRAGVSMPLGSSRQMPVRAFAMPSVVAERPGAWVGVCSDVAVGTPCVGDAHAAADRGLSGRRTPQ